MKKLVEQLESLKSERVILRSQEKFETANKLNFPIDIMEEEIKEKQDRIDIFAKIMLSSVRIDGQTRGHYNTQVEVPVIWDVAEAMEEERQKRIDKLYNK